MVSGVTKTPNSSKPDYPIPWIASYFIAGIVLILGSFVVLWFMNQFSSDYDYYDPDMTFFERIVLSPEPRRGDFTNLNGGDWQALCLIGWRGDLSRAIMNAKLPVVTAEALLEAYDELAEDTDQSEFIFLYADKSGAVKALAHPHGFAFAREGHAGCTTTSQPMLKLPVGNQH